MTLLEVKDAAGGYGHRRVLEGVNLRLDGGEMATLIGANGVGKSTLLRMLSGDLIPEEGEVKICGKPIERMKRSELAKQVSMVTTDRNADGMLRVEDVVEMGRYPHTGFMGRLDGHDREMVERAMEGVGVARFRGRRIGGLSDGERQKVMIARALAQETPVILLDEPTAFLDVASRIEVMGLLRRLAQEEGKGVVISTHDIAGALDMADVVWGVTDGGTVITGHPEELIEAQRNGVEGNLLDSIFAGRGVRFDAVRGDYRIKEY